MESFCFFFHFFVFSETQNASLLLCKCLSNNLFFSASFSLALWWWWWIIDGVFFPFISCSVCFLLHFLFSIHFIFIAVELLPGNWSLSAEKKNHCDSHLDYVVSIRDSNYEFTIFNGAVWGAVVKRTDDGRSSEMSIQLFRPTLGNSLTSAWTSRGKCIYVRKNFCVVCGNVSSTLSRKSSTEETGGVKRKARNCKSSAFFGADVYENGNSLENYFSLRPSAIFSSFKLFLYLTFTFCVFVLCSCI